MDVGSNPGDTHLVDVLQPHIKVLGDVVVGPTRNVTEFVVLIVDCDGIRVELIVRFTDQLQLRPDLQMVESLAPLPIAESRNVEVVQMHLPDRFCFFCSHNVDGLNGGCYLPHYKETTSLCQIAVQLIYLVIIVFKYEGIDANTNVVDNSTNDKDSRIGSLYYLSLMINE